MLTSAGQPTKDLHSKVSDSLTKHGIQTTPQQVNPHDETPLEAIGKIVGSTIDEGVHGEGQISNVHTAHSKLGLRQVMNRVLKKAA